MGNAGPAVDPRRGEVWLVCLDPVVGEEMSKTRPVVVVSSDGIARLAICLVAPVTGWKDHMTDRIHLVEVAPGSANGLEKRSAVDTLQLRGVSKKRFVRRIGRMDAALMTQVATAIAIVVEYA